MMNVIDLIEEILCFAPLRVKGGGADYVSRRLNVLGYLCQGQRFDGDTVRKIWTPAQASMLHQARLDRDYQIEADRVSREIMPHRRRTAEAVRLGVENDGEGRERPSVKQKIGSGYGQNGPAGRGRGCCSVSSYTAPPKQCG